MSVPSYHIVIVGAGASALVTSLLDDGYRHLTAVDISAAALEALRCTLGDRASMVELVRADVRSVSLARPADVWHDRATFHFLTDPADQAAYAARASEAVRPGGHLIVAAFAVGGPEQCSGLPIRQHSLESLDGVFGATFESIEATSSVHVTPWGADQAFLHALFRRRPDEVSPGC